MKDIYNYLSTGSNNAGSYCIRLFRSNSILLRVVGSNSSLQFGNSNEGAKCRKEENGQNYSAQGKFLKNDCILQRHLSKYDSK